MTKRNHIELRSDYLNFLRFSVTESAAATFTQVELDTNLSAERGIMMEIHSIEYYLQSGFGELRAVAASSTEQFECQITRETKSAILNMNDADLIGKYGLQLTRSAAIGTDTGPLYVMYDLVHKDVFELPIPYVKPSMFVGLLTTFASAGIVSGRIGYTLRDISREEFLELLVALQ